MSFHSSNKG